MTDFWLCVCFNCVCVDCWLFVGEFGVLWTVLSFILMFFALLGL